MYANIPAKPADSKHMQANRTAFVLAAEEMDEKTYEFVLWMISVIEKKILDGQLPHNRNENVAHNDAVFFISRLIWDGRAFGRKTRR